MGSLILFPMCRFANNAVSGFALAIIAPEIMEVLRNDV